MERDGSTGRMLARFKVKCQRIHRSPLSRVCWSHHA